MIKKEQILSEQIIMNAEEMHKALEALAAEIMQRHMPTDNLMLVGIQRRGADLAARLAPLLSGKRVSIASLDINLYRDDWTRLADGAPHIGDSHMPEAADDKIVILVDDVLFSGRTVRAALDAILDYGRPARIELLVLVDRGNRELPICADYVGRRIETRKEQHVDVLLRERDDRDAVLLR